MKRVDGASAPTRNFKKYVEVYIMAHKILSYKVNYRSSVLFFKELLISRNYNLNTIQYIFLYL